MIVAYREAAADALSNSEIEEKFIEEEVKYTFTYPMMNDVMRIIKEMNPRIVNQVFDNNFVKLFFLSEKGKQKNYALD